MSSQAFGKRQTEVCKWVLGANREMQKGFVCLRCILRKTFDKVKLKNQKKNLDIPVLLEKPQNI